MLAEETTIRSLLIPVEDGYLLLPSTVIAEVVGYIDPDPVPGESPAWLLGRIAWRGQRVPVVDFEQINGQRSAAPATRVRIIVLKALSDRADLPYFAILAQGIPRLVSVHPDGIEDLEEPMDDLPAVAMAVLAHGEPAFIPDMEYLEDTIRGELCN